VTPGFLQFKYALAERAQSLHVAFNWSAGMTSLMGGSGTPNYSVYVRKGAPITWDYGVDTTGTKDYEFALTGANANANWSGDLTQLLDPGDYYVEIVSTGVAGGTLQDIAITHVPAPQDDASVPQDDAGTDAGDGSGGRKGCDCRAASSAPAGAGLLALLGFAPLLVRRRR
jgi:MYXO-CTERM domain-containing protein